MEILPDLGLEQFSTTLLERCVAWPETKRRPALPKHWSSFVGRIGTLFNAYLRRLSYGPQDAQRLTEGFFARLLGKKPGRACGPTTWQVPLLPAGIVESFSWPTKGTRPMK
jgi:hypothetical protein